LYGWGAAVLGKNVEGEVVPVKAMKAYRGSRNMAPLILNLEARWSTSCPSRFTPGKQSTYPLGPREVLADFQNTLLPLQAFQPESQSLHRLRCAGSKQEKNLTSC